MKSAFHPLLARSEATVAAAVDSVDSSSPRLALSSIADPEPSVKLLFYPELSAKVASSSLILSSLELSWLPVGAFERALVGISQMGAYSSFSS
jgi:hypothetical protein